MKGFYKNTPVYLIEIELHKLNTMIAKSVETQVLSENLQYKADKDLHSAMQKKKELRAVLLKKKEAMHTLANKKLIDTLMKI